MRYPKDVPFKDPNKTVSLPKTGVVAPNSVTPYVVAPNVNDPEPIVSDEDPKVDTPPIKARESNKDSIPPVTPIALRKTPRIHRKPDKLNLKLFTGLC